MAGAALGSSSWGAPNLPYEELPPWGAPWQHRPWLLRSTDPGSSGAKAEHQPSPKEQIAS